MTPFGKGNTLSDGSFSTGCVWLVHFNYVIYVEVVISIVPFSSFGKAGKIISPPMFEKQSVRY
jgi:hypothetical protein